MFDTKNNEQLSRKSLEIDIGKCSTKVIGMQ